VIAISREHGIDDTAAPSQESHKARKEGKRYALQSRCCLTPLAPATARYQAAENSPLGLTMAMVGIFAPLHGKLSDSHEVPYGYPMVDQKLLDTIQVFNGFPISVSYPRGSHKHGFRIN
jgi:hypothetical protein